MVGFATICPLFTPPTINILFFKIRERLCRLRYFNAPYYILTYLILTKVMFDLPQIEYYEFKHQNQKNLSALWAGIYCQKYCDKILLPQVRTASLQS